MIITRETLFNMVAKANGLKSRQKITDVWSDCLDEWVFGSNAKGGYGETLTFHYKTDADLLSSLGFKFTMLNMRTDGSYEAK